MPRVRCVRTCSRASKQARWRNICVECLCLAPREFICGRLIIVVVVVVTVVVVVVVVVVLLRCCWDVALISARLGAGPSVTGLTVLTFGSSMPDCFSGIIVARRGRINLALSSALGSNVFDLVSACARAGGRAGGLGNEGEEEGKHRGRGGSSSSRLYCWCGRFATRVPKRIALMGRAPRDNTAACTTTMQAFCIGFPFLIKSLLTRAPVEVGTSEDHLFLIVTVIVLAVVRAPPPLASGD
jgi:hypothetical protein